MNAYHQSLMDKTYESILAREGQKFSASSNRYATRAVKSAVSSLDRKCSRESAPISNAVNHFHFYRSPRKSAFISVTSPPEYRKSNSTHVSPAHQPAPPQPSHPSGNPPGLGALANELSALQHRVASREESHRLQLLEHEEDHRRRLQQLKAQCEDEKVVLREEFLTEREELEKLLRARHSTKESALMQQISSLQEEVYALQAEVQKWRERSAIQHSTHDAIVYWQKDAAKWKHESEKAAVMLKEALEGKNDAVRRVTQVEEHLRQGQDDKRALERELKLCEAQLNESKEQRSQDLVRHTQEMALRVKEVQDRLGKRMELTTTQQAVVEQQLGMMTAERDNLLVRLQRSDNDLQQCRRALQDERAEAQSAMEEAKLLTATQLALELEQMAEGVGRGGERRSPPRSSRAAAQAAPLTSSVVPSPSRHHLNESATSYAHMREMEASRAEEMRSSKMIPSSAAPRVLFDAEVEDHHKHGQAAAEENVAPSVATSQGGDHHERERGGERTLELPVMDSAQLLAFLEEQWTSRVRGTGRQ
jgi:hypothetical protein